MTSAINVTPTRNNLSRNDILQWINTLVNVNHTKVEDLSNGVAYCNCIYLLFPDSISLKKVKCKATLERENMHNFRLLQASLAKLNVEKNIPIDRLVKGRFQDNIEFVQWFKAFFDANAGDRVFGPSQNKINKTVIRPKSLNQIHEEPNKSNKIAKKIKVKEPRESNANVNKTMEGFELSNSGKKCNNCLTIRKEFENCTRELNNTIIYKKGEMNSMEKERNFYYQKLRRIEKFCEGINKHQVSNAFKEGLIAINNILWEEMNETI